MKNFEFNDFCLSCVGADRTLTATAFAAGLMLATSTANFAVGIELMPAPATTYTASTCEQASLQAIDHSKFKGASLRERCATDTCHYSFEEKYRGAGEFENYQGCFWTVEVKVRKIGPKSSETCVATVPNAALADSFTCATL